MSFGLAKFFNAVSCGFWQIQIPDIVRKTAYGLNRIEVAPEGSTEKRFIRLDPSHEEFQLANRFMADMINRLSFWVSVFVSREKKIQTFLFYLQNI